MKTSLRCVAVFTAVAVFLIAADAQGCTSCGSPMVVHYPSLATASYPAYTTAFCSPAYACCGQEYKIVYRTVHEQRQTTAYRLQYETVYEERPVTTYKPVWETQYREVRYRVAKPVVETAEKEEVVTVRKPVWETQMRDASYTRIRYVEETAEREERYLVNRPVWETSEREQTHTVMRPVYETSSRTEAHTVMRPVTTYRTQLVDQGGFVDQTVYKPASPASRLRWVPGSCAVDPVTGASVYQRAGLYWVQVPRDRYEVQRVWQPNVVAQQVQQTAMVPQTEMREVPVQTLRYVPEQVVQKIPVRTCRIVQEEQVRKIPYTVRRPVEERVEQQVPVKVCRWVTERQVRRIPMTTYRMTYEERVEQVPHRVCRMVAVEETIRVPRCVEKRIPVSYTYTIPRVVCYRVPIDPCGNPITVTQSVAPSSSTTIIQEDVPPAKTSGSEATKWQSTPAPKPTEEERPKLESGDKMPQPQEAGELKPVIDPKN